MCGNKWKNRLTENDSALKVLKRNMTVIKGLIVFDGGMSTIPA